jgi:hypothetical protein
MGEIKIKTHGTAVCFFVGHKLSGRCPETLPLFEKSGAKTLHNWFI